MTSTTVKHLNQTYIREVNVNYRLTTQELLAVHDSTGVARFISSIMPDNSREHFFALYLDGAHQIISYSLISTGVANQALVHQSLPAQSLPNRRSSEVLDNAAFEVRNFPSASFIAGCLQRMSKHMLVMAMPLIWMVS